MFTKLRSLRGSLPNIEHVLIALKTTITAHQSNPNPGAQSVIATMKNYRPQRAPYAVHWRVGASFDNAQWYKVEWNKHIALSCGVSLYFNDILNQLAQLIYQKSSVNIINRLYYVSHVITQSFVPFLINLSTI